MGDILPKRLSDYATIDEFCQYFELDHAYQLRERLKEYPMLPGEVLSRSYDFEYKMHPNEEIRHAFDLLLSAFYNNLSFSKLKLTPQELSQRLEAYEQRELFALLVDPGIYVRCLLDQENLDSRLTLSMYHVYS